jgi:hypothetical protein
MSRASFDELVPTFLALKMKVSSYCDGEPSVLYEDAKKDEQLRKYCVQLHKVAEDLGEHEASAEGGVIAPINVMFRTEWNDYVTRWRKSIVDVWIYDDWPDIADGIVSINPIQSVYVVGSQDAIFRMEEHHFKQLSRELKQAYEVLDEGSDEQESIDAVVRMLQWSGCLGGCGKRQDLVLKGLSSAPS